MSYLVKVTVTPDDGEPYEVEATSRDVLVWEKTSRDHRTFQQLVNNQALTDIYRIAHIASRRLGLFGGDLAEFEKTCDVEQWQEESPEADPTRSAQSPGRASP